MRSLLFSCGLRRVPTSRAGALKASGVDTGDPVSTLKSPGTSELLPGRACHAPGGLLVAARVVQSPRKPSFEAASFEVASFDAPPFDDATFGAASFEASSFEDATTVLSSRSTGASKVVCSTVALTTRGRYENPRSHITSSPFLSERFRP